MKVRLLLDSDLDRSWVTTRIGRHLNLMCKDDVEVQGFQGQVSSAREAKLYKLELKNLHDKKKQVQIVATAMDRIVEPLMKTWISEEFFLKDLVISDDVMTS